MLEKNASCLMSCNASKEKKSSSISCVVLEWSVCVWSNQPVFTCCVQHSRIETTQHQTLISPNTGSACQFRIWKVRISIPRSRLSRPSFLTLHQSRNSTDVTLPSLIVSFTDAIQQPYLLDSCSVRATRLSDSFEEMPKYL